MAFHNADAVILVVLVVINFISFIIVGRVFVNVGVVMVEVHFNWQEDFVDTSLSIKHIFIKVKEHLVYSDAVQGPIVYTYCSKLFIHAEILHIEAGHTQAAHELNKA